MGEDVDLRDLETVESEIMTKLATTEAEKAMECISAGLKANNRATSTESDFNIDELLTRNRSERIERGERTEFTDNESGSESLEDEEEYAKEMNGFINDRSDESEREPSLESESENEEEEEAEFSDSEKKPIERINVGRGITFNFDDEEEEEGQKEEEVTTAVISSIVNDDDDIEAPVKKRNIAVIMDSDSD